MAHYAKIGLNGAVLSTHVVADEVQLLDGVDNEEMGRAYLESIHGWPIWKRFSLNTSRGVHYTDDGNGTRTVSADQSKAFRGNAAGKGGSYDEENDCFWEPKPYKDWVKDLSTYEWKAPVDFPTTTTFDVGGETKYYNITWDQDNSQWVCLVNNKKWNHTADPKVWIDI